MLSVDVTVGCSRIILDSFASAEIIVHSDKFDRAAIHFISTAWYTYTLSNVLVIYRRYSCHGPRRCNLIANQSCLSFAEKLLVVDAPCLSSGTEQ